MKNIRQLFFMFILGLLCSTGISQPTYKTAYSNGQQLFDMGRYELAMEAFKPAMEGGSNPYAPYASFYYAVSAYRSGFKPLARDMFLQISQKYPGWEFQNDTEYWLSIINFEVEDYVKAIQFVEKLHGTSLEKEALLVEGNFIRKIDSLDVLLTLLQENPEDEIIARAVLVKIQDIPLAERDFDLIDQISETFNIESISLNVPKISEKKDFYKVAVMFPFIYQNLEVSGIYLRKTLVIDLYEGIRQGVEDLKHAGINIELYAYDTRGDSATTVNLLENSEIQDMDLIIGPLVPGPSKLVSTYAFENQINFINPVSNNSDVVGNNPYSFLFNPSSITIGRRAGEFVAANLENKNILIYYGDRDSDMRMAEAFSEVVEVDSFRILSMKRVLRDSTEWIFDFLTEKIPVLDSLGNEVLDEEEKLMEELVIPIDSIGGIFLSTFDYKIASEVISAAAEREDTIQVIGHGKWMSDKTANYQYMQDLGLWMLAPGYIDYTSREYLNFERNYISGHHVMPSLFAIAGYECMLFVGQCLNRFGKYFQNGLNENIITDIGFGMGYDFRHYNNNQLIPVMKFEDEKLVIQNFTRETDDNQ